MVSLRLTAGAWRQLCSGCRRVRPAVSHSAGRRSFSSSGNDHSQNKVPVMSPLIWAVTAVGTIYFTCAAFDVWQDVKGFDKEDRHGLTFDKLETENLSRRRRAALLQLDSSPGPFVAGPPKDVWDNLSGPTKTVAGLILINIGVFGLSKTPSATAQMWWAKLGHTPALPWFKNSQLFTSMFAHTGPIHLGLNMMGLWNFGTRVAAKPPIVGSGSHFLAFYLSTGVLSSLGAQVSSLVFKQERYTFGIGASGAILGVFSAWVMMNPEGRVRIIPFPWVFKAGNLLEWAVAFEVLGMLGVWQALKLPINLCHSVHLAGFGIGASYVTYDRNAQAWATSRRAAFTSMKQVGLI